MTDLVIACRTVRLQFEDQQAVNEVAIPLINDLLPEDTETLHISIINPTGGALIGENNSLAINILANDNAHGTIEFFEVNFLRR